MAENPTVTVSIQIPKIFDSILRSYGKFRRGCTFPSHSPHFNHIPFWISCSTLMSGNIYVAFFIDWILVFSIFLPCFTLLATVGSLYVGLCSYINAMVADMRVHMSQSAFGSVKRPQNVNFWPIYIKEVHFHIQIIRYGACSIARAQQISPLLATTSF